MHQHAEVFEYLIYSYDVLLCNNKVCQRRSLLMSLLPVNNQSINQSIIQSINQSNKHSLTHSLTQSINQSNQYSIVGFNDPLRSFRR